MKNEKRNIKKQYTSFIEDKPVIPAKAEVKPEVKPEKKMIETVVIRQTEEKKPEEKKIEVKKPLVSIDLKLRY